MKKLIVILLTVLLCCVSCTDEEGARKALLDAGYKPISVGGYDAFAGSKGDTYVTKFKAYSPNDSTRIVTGVVCRGVLKGSTIRLN